ncbi:MAG TPA: AMIN domain-containing protein [Vicinamibacterales bacterium]|jgi:hypothetical protein
MTLTIIAAWIVLAISAIGTQTRAPAQATRLEQITIVPATDRDLSVVMQADGAISAPTVGVTQEGRPRIYLDFVGLLPAESGAAPDDQSIVRRVRVGLHSDSPRVTRVVIDLARPAAYRVEPAQDPARFVLTISAAAPPGQPSLNRAETAAAPVSRPSAKPPEAAPPSPGTVPKTRRPETAAAPVSTPGVKSAEPPPAAPVTPSKPQRSSTAAPRKTPAPAQLVGLVDRLEKLRPLLKAIDARGSEPGVTLQEAAVELEAIEKAGAEIEPPTRGSVAHGRITQACALALRAVKGRLESDASGNAALSWNAASAAAGALVLLNQARADLGLPTVSSGAGG